MDTPGLRGAGIAQRNGRPGNESLGRLLEGALILSVAVTRDDQRTGSLQAQSAAAGAPVDKVAPANDFSRKPDPADKFGGDAG